MEKISLEKVYKMSKAKLHPCIACYMSKNDEDVPKCTKQKLSRKKKKKLKKAYLLLNTLSPGSLEMWEGVSSCSLASDYKHFLPLINKINYFQKNKKVFIELKKLCYSMCDELEFIRYKNDYFLAFPWECDNGLYTEEGHMPMQFGKDPDDGTWAYEASKEYCEHFCLNILEIKNESQFLKLAGKKLNGKT